MLMFQTLCVATYKAIQASFNTFVYTRPFETHVLVK